MAVKSTPTRRAYSERMNTLPIFQTTAHHFDARGIAKRFRHAAIFGALESLDAGETMRFVNDHDPLPLLNQLRQRYGFQVDIAYVSREPGNIVIDFTVLTEEQSALAEVQAEPLPSATAGQGCGGGGCGCSGGR